MPLKVGITSGIYTAARSEELATPIKKLGYMITRGATALEMAADVAHEIPYTHGKDIRHMAKKQGVDMLFHGDLMVPMCIPERADWRDAHDRICKSVRSAVHAGAKYIDFHSSLNVWLELMTFAGRKLSSTFVDHEGRFISHILKECEDLRNWFVEHKWDEFARQILTDSDSQEVDSRGRLFQRRIEEMERDAKEKHGEEKRRLVERIRAEQISENEAMTEDRRIEDELKDELDRIATEETKKVAKERINIYKDVIRDKLAEGTPWDTEELRAESGTLDGYHIMAHYLFYTKDPIWMEMTNIYKNVLDKYALNYGDKNWLEKAWRSAENNNDKEFKEFFYAVVGAKYLEGHLRKLFEWMNGDFKKELAKHDDGKELQEIADNLIIAIENSDARDPSHAGLFLLWRLRQIYAAVKTIRKTLKNDKISIIVDHEHIASQGLDSWLEVEETVKMLPDFGSYVISIHANHPNPLHPHEPIELGDVKLYELLFAWRKTGMGRKSMAYIIFERGGGEDPFKQSVDALRLMAKYLEEDVEPKDLPIEFFGLKGPISGMIERQMQIIRDRMFEPMKDLLEMSEEDWGILSAEARKKGRAEVWKKAEFR